MLEELTGLLVEVPNLNSSIKTASHLYEGRKDRKGVGGGGTDKDREESRDRH